MVVVPCALLPNGPSAGGGRTVVWFPEMAPALPQRRTARLGWFAVADLAVLGDRADLLLVLRGALRAAPIRGATRWTRASPG